MVFRHLWFNNALGSNPNQVLTQSEAQSEADQPRQVGSGVEVDSNAGNDSLWSDEGEDGEPEADQIIKKRRTCPQGGRDFGVGGG